VSVADFIADQQDIHHVPVTLACRALGLSRSWFYKWRSRPQTARGVRRTVLATRITELFDASGRTYGSPRITLDLRAEGWQVSVNTVARLMAELGLAGRAKPRRRRGLTRQGKRPVARDLVRRQFDAVAPDVLWCGDMTEIGTDEGKCYLATVIDMFSRRMLGYAIGDRHDAGLVVDALRMAVTTRGGVDGVIFHSDRGSEYTSEQFGHACARMGVVQSMGRVGSALDNAVSESFNSVLKVEYVHRHTFATRGEARLRIATWITGFYNTRRRHSAAGGHPPVVFEQMMAEARARIQQDQMRIAA
jgi:putative transposase